MYKLSTFAAQTDYGYSAIPLFGPADVVFEKTASAQLLPSVSAFINRLTPKPGSQYVLVNALGAGEYYGSNIHGDYFPEEALIHCPPGWQRSPIHDKALAKSWTYGYPTFYGGHPFAHHINKDPTRAYGEIEVADWNDHMKRVELVVRVDHDKCLKYGGIAIWDKLRAGDFVDVSMGAKVPFDTSSITLDWKLYREAQDTFDAKKHKHVGIAVLEFHKKLKEKNGVGIRGVNVTRADYDDYCRSRMNQILPDGRKIFVYNDYPRFFDISFVKVGADSTAKTMVFMASGVHTGVKTASWAQPSYSGYTLGMEKAASVNWTELLKQGEETKGAAIRKELMPSSFSGKAIPLITRMEPDLPDTLINELAGHPLNSALSTVSSLCIILKPREFQRIILISAGMPELADRLNSSKLLFPLTDRVSDEVSLSEDCVLPDLLKKLVPFILQRTAASPALSARASLISNNCTASDSATPFESLESIGPLYNSYRRQLLNLAPLIHSALRTASSPGSCRLAFAKLASASEEDLFTPLSYKYLVDAYRDDIPVGSH